jgi:acyl-coenzyme A thioesterase PaaI-like protein
VRNGAAGDFAHAVDPLLRRCTPYESVSDAVRLTPHDEAARRSIVMSVPEADMPFAPANENYEGAVRKLLLGMPYLQWLDLSFVRIAPGEVDFAMPLRREITFDGKSVQAGPIGSLLDFAGGAAAFTLVPEDEMLATSDFTVKLVAPAVGDRFIGRDGLSRKPKPP